MMAGAGVMVLLTVGELFELLLQGDGGVVRPEHLRRQTGHQRAQVFVQDARLQQRQVAGKPTVIMITTTGWQCGNMLQHC